MYLPMRSQRVYITVIYHNERTTIMFKKGCCIPGGSFMPQGVASVETAYDIMKGG